MRALPLLVATLLLPMSCAHAEAPMRTIETAELTSQSSYDLAAARAWKLPAGISFALDGGPVVEGNVVRLAGWLSNASSEPQLIVVFPSGPWGFFLEPAKGAATPAPDSGPPRPPPAPPPPMAFTLPPMSRLRIVTPLFLGAWIWDATRPRELAWTFQFWNEPKPRGQVMIP